MLRLYNKSFVYMYGLQFYDTLQVIKRYTGKTQLTITFAEQDDAVHFIERDGWIVLEDGEPFVIRHIEQTDETVTVTAYGGHALLEQRITLPAAKKYAVEATGSADEVVKAFINASLRGLPLATAAAQSGTSISEQSRLKPLADEVQRVLIGAGRGEKFTMDADNERVVFDTYLGTDRTRGNTEDNPPVVFGVKYKNIEGYKYREDGTLLQSTIYVGGAGEGVDREIAVVGNAATGIDRVERFVDARDVDAGDTTLLAARGGQAVIPVQKVAEITALSDANLVYGVDYELGDIVTALIERKTYEQAGDYFNPVTTELAINQRITEVCITRTGDGAEYVDLRFGEQPITQTQLQALHAEVAQLKSVEGGSGGMTTLTSGATTTTGTISLSEPYTNFKFIAVEMDRAAVTSNNQVTVIPSAFLAAGYNAFVPMIASSTLFGSARIQGASDGDIGVISIDAAVRIAAIYGIK